jgi:outer membrane protease
MVANVDNNTTKKSNKIGFKNHSISISYLNTVSHTYVYDPSNISYKLSELIYESKNTRLIGYSFDYIVNKKSTINVNIQTKLKDGSTTMDDYDWLDTNNPSVWSHWSNHPDTILDNFSILDIVLNQKIKPYKHIKQDILLGFKHEYKKFKAYNGSYIYSSSGIKRDQKGVFNGLGITYIEQYYGIYLGYKASVNINHKIILNGTFKFSPIMSAQNSDTHHFRSFTNKTEFHKITMFNIDIGIKYNYIKKNHFYANYIYNKYSKEMAITTRYYDDGRAYTYPGDALKNKYSMLKIGYEILF